MALVGEELHRLLDLVHVELARQALGHLQGGWEAQERENGGAAAASNMAGQGSRMRGFRGGAVAGTAGMGGRKGGSAARHSRR